VKRGYYILDAEGRPAAVDLLQWGRWFENANRVIDYTEITSEVRVSTVFLGVDRRLWGDGPPLLFETMIFGGPLNENQWRYASRDDALTGHAAAVRKARVVAKQGHVERTKS
jgi:hypothetical protein